MRRTVKLPLSHIRVLAVCALALAACAAPATVAPTPTPTSLPPTATAIPPTAVPSTSTPASQAPVPATSIRFEAALFGLTVDTDGNLYLSTCTFGSGTSQILKVDRYGLLSVFAGTDVPGFSGDGGPARSAKLICTTGLAFDHQGHLDFSDNNRIRHIDQNGIITTVAGSGPVQSLTGDNAPPVFAGDGGPATAALVYAADIAFDPSGNMYISDVGNERIRKVDQRGIITTVAGTGTAGFSGDGGPAVAAELTNLAGLAFDADGNLYFTDGARVRKIDKRGIITTVAGTGELGFSGDGGPATAAIFTALSALAFDATGNLYVSDGFDNSHRDNRIRQIDRQGIIRTVVGNGELGVASGDGDPATAATINGPTAMTFDGQGNLYFIDSGNNRVRKVDRNGIITTVAGGAP